MKDELKESSCNDNKSLNKAIDYVKNNYSESSNGEILLLGNVAELINILTGSDLDYNDLINKYE